MFMLKKLISGLVQPLPLLILLMGVALCLLWCNRWLKNAKLLLSICWLALFTLSTHPFADWWLEKIEDQYTTYQGNGHFDYIVVLGGGYTYNPQWAISANLLNNSLARVTEGVRLYYQYPGKKLIFTGASSQREQPSSAAIAARTAMSLGVNEHNIIQLSTPKDTYQEAEAVQQKIGAHPFLLVTSASHMPRALKIFHQRGLFPIPAPANQTAITSHIPWWSSYFPSALFLSHSERAWHETLGIFWFELIEPFSQD